VLPSLVRIVGSLCVASLVYSCTTLPELPARHLGIFQTVLDAAATRMIYSARHVSPLLREPHWSEFRSKSTEFRPTVLVYRWCLHVWNSASISCPWSAGCPWHWLSLSAAYRHRRCTVRGQIVPPLIRWSLIYPSLPPGASVWNTAAFDKTSSVIARVQASSQKSVYADLLQSSCCISRLIL